MSGLLFEWHSDELEKQLNRVAGRIGNAEMLRLAGAIVRESVRTNFAAGGRPRKWKRLKTRQGQPLRDTGRLQNSVTSKVSGNVVYVGTNVVYAAVPQFGAKKGSFGEFVVSVAAHDRTAKTGKQYMVRAHSRRVRLPRGNIPARPFLLVQDEDRVEIEAVSARYIIKGNQ
ncbi:MAG TPA: hypothetical protein ENJ30_01965 [Desulfobulbaceae bacterium]|nr:hypothetical protein [Desulfobulbaceae bacterium]